MSGLYVGLISGTSVDGIDAVLARIDDSSVTLVGALTDPWTPQLAARINKLIATQAPAWLELGTLDVELGRAFAAAALKLLERCGVDAADVTAIGHHGQTVHHAPDASPPFTIQIGDANAVAARTGIATVADLRGFDMAVGGQGAPLVPAFHEWLLRDDREHRVVANIGGIANITTLCPDAPTLGCDTGPGNTLLDAWIRRHMNRDWDADGCWAASGTVSETLLNALLADPWFALPAPKSTGRELFNERWLDAALAAAGTDLAPEDVQATLAELTVVTIVDGIRSLAPQCERIVVCGGGAYNTHLLRRLGARSGMTVHTSAEHGVAPEWIEGLAFAWLAHARLNGIAGNVASVTGAHQQVILGGIYSGNSA